MGGLGLPGAVRPAGRGALVELDPPAQEGGGVRIALAELAQPLQRRGERQAFAHVLGERRAEYVLERVPALGGDQSLGGHADVQRLLVDEGATEFDDRLLAIGIVVDGGGEALGVATLGEDVGAVLALLDLDDVDEIEVLALAGPWGDAW